MKNLGYLFLSSLLVMVTACSHNPNVTVVEGSYHPPPSQWRIKGKLGIQTDADSGSVIIDWQQRKDQYSIRVNGPFGQGSAWVKGNTESITIERTGLQSMTSTVPEQLLKETLGWVLPINDLRYWVQGIPNSTKVIDKPVYTEQGLLATFEQADWFISISRYRLIDKWLLPRRVKLKRDNVQLILAIREWQFLQPIMQPSSTP
jgi:outer membrane lipoprotein LolB